MATQTYHRGIRDLKIAKWQGDNSYGAAYDIKGARNMSLTVLLDSDTLRGDDADLDQFTNVTGVTVNIEMAAVDLEAQELFIGGTLQSNADYEDLLVGGDDHVVPYVALAGRIVSSSGPDLFIFVPKAKISGNLQLTAQVDTYMIPQAEFRGVYEGETNRLYRLRKMAEGTTLTIPLPTTAGA